MKVACWVLAACTLHAQAISEWAFSGPDHRLHYRPDSHGNTIMDFSAAGYRGGGAKLPSAAASQRLTPAPGDNTARIQAALDQAAGAVVLAAGDYDIAGTLTIARSGVVLRGEPGATIRLTGKPHRFLEIHGSGTWHEEGAAAPVLDAYVPSGAASFRVRGASAFHPGDRVLVLHPVTAEWIHFMGMDTLFRDGKPQTWIRPGSVIRTDRVVDSVDGDRITLDVPLSDALDSRFTAASLVRYSFPGRITEAGVEGLRIVAPFEDVPISEPQFTALRMDAVEDGWARDLEIQETQNGIVIGPGAKRVTLANVRVTHSQPHSGSAAPADFSLQGTQILLDRCRVAGEGTWPVVTQAEVTGPLVVLNFTADHGGVSPHQRWATGLLVDGGKFPGATERKPGIAFSNRTTAGSGHGWDIGWAVAWNVISPYLLVQQPPGALNWCIGCIGKPVTAGNLPNGIFDSPGKPVEPASLYLQQLRDRLGPDALRNIGY
ncbi:MAG TPA: hypothetical protein VKX45_17590 [Bryobacteraceae bacterium]|jgi:hypothetical protein|nr:hypothetical protein [Bryobacteraceae bacterium]